MPRDCPAVGAGRGSSQQFKLPACSALCVPLFDQEQTRPIGALTLLCNDDARAWSSDEQALVRAAAPLFALHLTRERLAAQAALISGARTADEMSRSKEMSDHAAKVVHEMRVVHADALKKQREDFRAELRSLSEAHADEKRELEAALVEANARVEKAERDSAVRMHKMMEGLELQHIAELDALREDFAARDPSAPSTQPRGKSRPASAPGTPGAPVSPKSPTSARLRSDEQLATPAAARGGALATLPAALAERASANGQQPAARSERASSGTSTKSGRPVPASAVTVSGGAPRVVRPEVDIPKNSKAPPPPPPPNWESTVLNDGQVLLFTESLPAEAREGGAAAAKQAGEEEEEEGYAFPSNRRASIRSTSPSILTGRAIMRSCR